MNSALLTSLLAAGATTTSLPSAWREACIAYGAEDGTLKTYLTMQGYTGSVADMLMKFLGDKGYVGTLTDRMAAAAAADDVLLAQNQIIATDGGAILTLARKAITAV